MKYRPGVDVRGRKVAPADLHGASPIKIPNVITYDVKFDIKNYLGKAEADAKAASAASIAADKAKSAATTASAAKIGENLGDGVVGKVKNNIASGRLTFNGQSLGGSDQKEAGSAMRVGAAPGTLGQTPKRMGMA